VPRAETYRRLVERPGYRERERLRAAARRAAIHADPQRLADYRAADRERARADRARKKAERGEPAVGGATTMELSRRLGIRPDDLVRILRDEVARGHVYRSRYGRGTWHLIPSSFPAGTLDALAELGPNGDGPASAELADRVNGDVLRRALG
jgi:hypothetical protein